MEQKLDIAWKMRILGAQAHGLSEQWMDTKVPGSVYATLLAHGLIPDPFRGEEELHVLPLMAYETEWRCVFEASADAAEAGRAWLRFDGVDTLADVLFNEKLIGQTNNMHRQWLFPVRPRNGENVLLVRFHSPTAFIAQADEQVHAGGITDAMRGFPHLRKAHCMFGWDWGPRLPDAGLFRPVTLVYSDDPRIWDVRVHQDHTGREQRVRLTATCTTDPFAESDLLRYRLLTPDGQWLEGSPDGEIDVPNAQLWWPRGYGDQPLYTLCIELWSNGCQTDRWERRIGLRTMEIDMQPDEYGQRFAQRVNGVDVFAMGANYIPQDCLITRVTSQRIRTLLLQAVEANHNTVRVWGGGYYPDDVFYDVCDELGLMVWQDSMFACASYELTDDFEENVLCELRDNVRRIRHHACLCLWCGNNELEMQIGQNTWGTSVKQRYDYLKLFEYAIPRLMRRECPDVFFWLSSPSSGGNFDDTCAEDRGDSHFWDVWHGGKPFAEYRKHYFRYLSEFGFQSLPCLQTVRSFAAPEDCNLFSRVMEMHQRNAGANGKILGYFADYYLYPSSFEHLIYASQLLQAQSIRYGIEHFRRNRGRCMGTLVWQLNDIWPGASWSGIDYFGRRKALHFIEKRAFAPVMISCEEIGEMTERPSCVEEPHPIEKSIRLHVANETRQAVYGMAHWELRDALSHVLQCRQYSVSVPPLAGLWLEKICFPEVDERGAYVSYGFDVAGRTLSEGTVLFTKPKHFRFANPHLRCRVEGDCLYVAADAYAQFVQVEGGNELLLEDNFFDLNGDERYLHILQGTTENLKITSVYDMAR